MLETRSSTVGTVQGRVSDAEFLERAMLEVLLSVELLVCWKVIMSRKIRFLTQTIHGASGNQAHRMYSTLVVARSAS